MAESELHKTIKLQAVGYLSHKGYYVAKKEVPDHYYGIVDAWGIRPRDLYTMGIEVKVSRADWMAAKHKDHTTQETAKYGHKNWTSMNEVYYACPSGLIMPDEVHECVGLLWFDGKRFRPKKKPKFVQIHLGDKMQTMLRLYEPWITTWNI